jgi:hypothetical protein
MNIRRILPVALMLASFAGQANADNADAQFDPFAKAPTLSAPSAADVRAQVRAWLDSRNVDPLLRHTLDVIWQNDAAQATVEQRIDLLTQTFALVDDRARALVDLCSKPRNRVVLPSQAWLFERETPPLVRDNLRLIYGRWLSHETLYDESLDQLAGLSATDVIDPATLLFYQGVGYHRLLSKNDGLKSIRQLLEEVSDSPLRYKAVAALMLDDLSALEDDSLDHIARRMDDIRRRLELGRAGSKVRRVEDGVIASLDKLIDELEKQQQQQQGGGGGSSGGMQPSSPMPDSRLARANGAGEVDRRNIGKSSGWGDMPAKQREEALQQIGKDFPAHYRDAIEQYFRKLATEKSDR